METGTGVTASQRRKTCSRRGMALGSQDVDIVFPREEAFLYALSGKKDDDSTAPDDLAEDGGTGTGPASEVQVMKQLKFLNLLVTSPSAKKRAWIWHKILPSIVLSQGVKWPQEGLHSHHHRKRPSFPLCCAFLYQTNFTFN